MAKKTPGGKEENAKKVVLIQSLQKLRFAFLVQLEVEGGT